MKPETPPSPNNLPSLENLDLGLSQFVSGEQKMLVEKKTVQAVFNGVTFSLHIFDESLYGDYREVDIIIFSKDGVKVGKLTLFLNLNEKKIKTSVTNADRQVEGFGRALWELSLKLVQKLIDQLNMSLVHEVRPHPRLGLTREKWEELFIPLLEKYKYTQKHDGLWEKIYIPNKV